MISEASDYTFVNNMKGPFINPTAVNVQRVVKTSEIES